MHELLNTVIKNKEQMIRSDMKTPFFESLSKSQELLEILRKFMIIVDTIKAKF